MKFRAFGDHRNPLVFNSFVFRMKRHSVSQSKRTVTSTKDMYDNALIQLDYAVKITFLVCFFDLL